MTPEEEGEEPDTPLQPEEPTPGSAEEKPLSLRELIESAISYKRNRGRYAVACAHPFDPEGLPIQQIEDAAQEWFVIFYSDLRSLGRRPKSLTVTVSQDRLVASCTLRLHGDMEAMSLHEDLTNLMCEHAGVSVQPLDQL